MLIMKFGGSSVADENAIRRVADIIIDEVEKHMPVVVVSAMKGVTDSLVSAACAAERGDPGYAETLEGMRTRHRRVVENLAVSDSQAVMESLDAVFDELGNILHGVELVRECSSRTRDLVLGFGERLSSRIVAACLRHRRIPARAMDARDFIRTDGSHGRAVVDFPATDRLVQQNLNDSEDVAVVTGFIASTADGVATTLGRNGSDYTASILGAALNAEAVEIWTDVDGLLTADPRIVANAWVMPEISFQEAMELSFFGAEVIHPYTLVPVMEKNLPVFIKNVANPAAPGTRISRTAAPKNRPITGIASMGGVSMVTIEGGGMMGMPGVAGRIFTSVSAAKVNIIMITQASSEHSISLVCRQDEALLAAEALRCDLSEAIASRVIRNIEIADGLEIIAVIGENMRGQIGLSGRLFSALGDADINILAIAQGSTELNISLVIHSKDRVQAITAIHRTFIG